MIAPKIRFPEFHGEYVNDSLSEISDRVRRKNSDNQTDIPLTIASIEGLVDQRTYFGKTVASKDMSGYYLLQNGEFAYNKSYSKGFPVGSIKRLDKYAQGALSTLYICFALKPGCILSVRNWSELSEKRNIIDSYIAYLFLVGFCQFRLSSCELLLYSGSTSPQCLGDISWF